MLTPEEEAAMNDALGGGATGNTTPVSNPQQQTTPAPTQQNGSNNEEPADDEINTLKAKIELMSKDLAEMDSKLDDEFYAQIDSQLSEEELDLRFADDQKPYLKAVEAKRKAFISERKKAFEDELDKLTSEYGVKRENAQIKTVQKSFLAAHPDANLKTLQDWVTNDITPRQKAEIEKNATDLASYLEAVYAAFKEANPDKKTETKKQPPNFSEENTLPAKDPMKGVEDTAFAKSVGLA